MDNRLCSPLWPICDGHFTPFRFEPARLSAEAASLVEGLQALDRPESIYLRGSILEQTTPFVAADLDLFVIHPHQHLESFLAELSSLTSRGPDIKWLSPDKLAKNPMFQALLFHRSMHISGPSFPQVSSKADTNFCWRHWVEYGVVDLPSHLHCSSPYAVIHFKRLVRCFGVILLLRKGQFSRDIGFCIEYAGSLRTTDKNLLTKTRKALEQKKPIEVDIRGVKQRLIELFDDSWDAAT